MGLIPTKFALSKDWNDSKSKNRTFNQLNGPLIEDTLCVSYIMGDLLVVLYP